MGTRALKCIFAPFMLENGSLTSVEDAYHRALNMTLDQFHDMRKDDNGAVQVARRRYSSHV
jgi:hypothetical protein